MTTYGNALAEIGATEIPGTDLIVAVMDGNGISHAPISEVRDQQITDRSHVYVAGGAFAAGTVTQRQGRKQENLRSVLWLQFDADLVDYSGMPHEILWDLPQEDIDRWIDAQRTDLIEACEGVGIPIHRIDYTGYGICAYVYLEPVETQDITVIREAHKAFIRAINERAGIKLVDPQVSDSGTRITRLPGSYNVKNPILPRLVRTLKYDAGRYIKMDQIHFALKRAGEQETFRQSLPKPKMMPAGMIDEIVAALEDHWTLGQKHAMALAVTGMLAKAGVPETQALDIIDRLSRDDQKPFDRVKCVQDTYARMQSGLEVRGFTALKEMVPESAISYVADRIGRIKAATTSAVFTHTATTKDQVFNPTTKIEILPLPEICYQGWVGDYVQMMVPLSEAPEQFHLAAGLGLVAATAGRRVSNHFLSSDLYANLYIMIIGVAGESRKDTAIKFATRLPRRQRGRQYHQAPFKLITDVGSPQGLLEIMKDDPNLWLYVTEYERLASNAHRSATTGLLPTINEAWDSNDSIESNIKSAPIQVRLPYLNIIAAVQPEILSQHMLPEDISNGYASRWLYVPGKGGSPKASPPNLNEDEAFELYGRLLAVVGTYGHRDRNDHNTIERPTRLVFTDEANVRWVNWYEDSHRYEARTTDEASLRSRLGQYIRKIALIYAITDGAQEYIEIKHLEAGIAFVEWSWAHVRQMVGEWGTPMFNAIENKIETILKSNGPMKRRELQNACRSRRWSSVEFGRVLDAMIGNETVERDVEGKLAWSVA